MPKPEGFEHQACSWAIVTLHCCNQPLQDCQAAMPKRDPEDCMSTFIMINPAITLHGIICCMCSSRILIKLQIPL